MKPIKVKLPNRIEYRNEKGYLHRTDGPAIEWSDSSISYYLNDKRYLEQEWKQEVVKIKLKRILNL